jgi:hypothetical protein
MLWVLTLLAWAGLSRGEETAAIDPAIFVMPRKAPVFRKLTEAAEWDRQFAKAFSDLGNLDRLKDSEHPSAGIRIDRVDEGTQAEAIGLKVGDIIREIDRQPVGQKEFRTFREDHDQQMTLVGTDGMAREVTIRPGTVGFNGRPVVRPELVYLRQGARSVKWDAYAAVGAARCIDDPKLAETAWHMAMKAGYVEDWLSDYCGAQIAWRQGRSQEAVDFCALLNARKDIPAPLDVEGFSRALAIANFKIEQALGGRMAFAPPVLEGSLPPERMERLEQLLDIHRRLPEAQRTGPSPGEIASYVKTSLLKEMEPWPNQDEGTNRFRHDVRDELARQAGPFEMKVPCGHYRVIPELPRGEAADVELMVQARMHPADPLLSGATATFMVGLIDGDEAPVPDRNGQDSNRHQAFLSAWVEVWGMGIVDQRGDTDRGTIVQAVNVGESVLNHRQFTLRLIHAAGRDEVWIDQRRLVYLPAMRNPRKIGFRLYATGITVETRVGFSKLDPKQLMGN